MDEIIMDFDEEGHVKIEVKGVSGPRCDSLTKDIEEELGELVREEKKPEYFQQQKTIRHVKH